MGLLIDKSYDPAIAVQQTCASALALTALDTTNLRATFTPNVGFVEVRASVAVGGGTGGFPSIILGILEGATVIARLVPLGAAPSGTQNTASQAMLEFGALIPASIASHTWDLAYGVESALTGTNLQYGGPNDASGNDAYGGIGYEIWDAQNAISAIVYDPAIAATASTTSLKLLTVFDTTNLRQTFTAPASGNVFWRIRGTFAGTTSTPFPTIMLGILESTSVVARKTAVFATGSTRPNANSGTAVVASGVVTGVSAGSHTWDASYAIQLVSQASGALKWGGPNDTTANNAWGALTFELWAA